MMHEISHFAMPVLRKQNHLLIHVINFHPCRAWIKLWARQELVQSIIWLQTAV